MCTYVDNTAAHTSIHMPAHMSTSMRICVAHKKKLWASDDASKLMSKHMLKRMSKRVSKNTCLHTRLRTCRTHMLSRPRLYIGSISASPTACLLCGYGRAGTQNDRSSQAVILSTGTPVSAQWRCRRRCRYRAKNTCLCTRLRTCRTNMPRRMSKHTAKHIVKNG